MPRWTRRAPPPAPPADPPPATAVEAAPDKDADADGDVFDEMHPPTTKGDVFFERARRQRCGRAGGAGAEEAHAGEAEAAS